MHDFVFVCEISADQPEGVREGSHECPLAILSTEHVPSASALQSRPHSNQKRGKGRVVGDLWRTKNKNTADHASYAHRVLRYWGGVRSGPGEARTILLFLLLSTCAAQEHSWAPVASEKKNSLQHKKKSSKACRAVMKFFAQILPHVM